MIQNYMCNICCEPSSFVLMPILSSGDLFILPYITSITRSSYLSLSQTHFSFANVSSSYLLPSSPRKFLLNAASTQPVVKWYYFQFNSCYVSLSRCIHIPHGSVITITLSICLHIRHYKNSCVYFVSHTIKYVHVWISEE